MTPIPLRAHWIALLAPRPRLPPVIMTMLMSYSLMSMIKE
jgi:hypothetical protein